MGLTGFFLLDTAWRVLGIALLVLLLAAAAHALVFRAGLAGALEGKAPVAPFFTSVTALFALFVAFAAADAWSRDDHAAVALGQESRALSAVRAAGRALGEPGAPLGAALADYLSVSLREEWGELRNLRPSAAAGAALHRLEEAALAAARPAFGPDEAGAIRHELVRGVHALQAARDARLRFGSDFGQGWKWGGLLLLCFASQLSIALVHLDRPRTALVTQALFGLAATTGLGILAGFEGPYAGIGAVLPTPLLTLQAALAAP
ncbi:bestrophin-like domain [Crenalkalicoccus roseus]|uniref:bestrophin-like domain n=1 Tax=Crenalkalicoccus roseus TaxID=1485588 RepID=UPI0010809823|nr:hypothetical protein [Crenalkalicoccus roseus]